MDPLLYICTQQKDPEALKSFLERLKCDTQYYGFGYIEGSSTKKKTFLAFRSPTTILLKE